MKKHIIKFMLAVAPIIFLASCNEDDIKPAPSINVAGAPNSALPGDQISLEVTVTAPNGAQSLTANVGATQIASETLSGATSETRTIKYTIPTNAIIGSQIVITIQATDKKNLPSQVTIITVTVNDPVIELSGTLTSRTLDATKRYLLKGQVFIPSGVTVTIPAGTVILGDKATKATLVVERGGTLNCNGTAAAPVVMTSSQSIGERDKGDWGGLVILGRAFTNQNTGTGDDATSPGVEGISPAKFFGSNVRTNDTESSGTYTYLRVEYAGIELTPNNETNSITMGGLGSGTTLEYVQVSFGGDDGFEFFGGVVNGKYLISHSTWDDDFDGDFGWSGKVQFGLVVRNPFFADQSQSNAFELDNGPNDNDTPAGLSTMTFSNITVYGPRDRADRSISANNVHNMDLRRRVAASIFNSVITGFPTGLRFNQATVLTNYQAGTGVLANNIQVSGASYAAGSGVAVADVQAYWERTGGNNQSRAIPARAGTDEAPVTEFYNTLGLRLNNFFARHTINSYPVDPDFTVIAGSDIATGASFSDAKLSGSFFTSTTYRGAFGTTDWTNGWANFRPIETVY